MYVYSLPHSDLKYVDSLYFVGLKGYSRSFAVLPELTKKNYENMRAVVHGRGRDGVGRVEKSFLLNPYHLAVLQRIRRKKPNMMNVLCTKMGLPISIKVACHKTKNLLTLQVSKGYLRCRHTYSEVN